jgi:hypothetical protein
MLMDESLLSMIDSRAQSLGLNRTAYLTILARQDLTERNGSLALQVNPIPQSNPPVQSPSPIPQSNPPVQK